MAKIELEGMAFYAYHGCFKEERKVGTRFEVCCSIEYDAKKAALSDDINDALDYVSVYRIIQKEMQKQSYILENLVSRIIKVLKSEFPEIKRMTLKVSKLMPPLGGNIEKVSVSMDA